MRTRSALLVGTLLACDGHDRSVYTLGGAPYTLRGDTVVWATGTARHHYRDLYRHFAYLFISDGGPDCADLSAASASGDLWAQTLSGEGLIFKLNIDPTGPDEDVDLTGLWMDDPYEVWGGWDNGWDEGDPETRALYTYRFEDDDMRWDLATDWDLPPWVELSAPASGRFETPYWYGTFEATDCGDIATPLYEQDLDNYGRYPCDYMDCDLGDYTARTAGP